ncbi:MAG: hypothetical protein ACYDCP_11010 [Thermoplasmataceae archaeon]
MSDLLELVKQITDLKLENAELKRTIKALSLAGTKANPYQDPPRIPVIMPFISPITSSTYISNQEKEIIENSRNIASLLSTLFSRTNQSGNKYNIRNSKGQFAKPKSK